MTNFANWDVKYYRTLHVLRMQARGENPVSYPAFSRRLRKMNLHDAIYTPRCEYNVRHRKPTPIQDRIRRFSKLKENNIPPIEIETDKPSILRKFISLFR